MISQFTFDARFSPRSLSKIEYMSFRFSATEDFDDSRDHPTFNHGSDAADGSGLGTSLLCLG